MPMGMAERLRLHFGACDRGEFISNYCIIDDRTSSALFHRNSIPRPNIIIIRLCLVSVGRRIFNNTYASHILVVRAALISHAWHARLDDAHLAAVVVVVVVAVAGGVFELL